MKYPSKEQIIFLQNELIRTSGGLPGIRDEALLESAINTPLQTVYGRDLYPSIVEKAARLAFGLINNHPFIDGNKRVGTHTMLLVLRLNGVELSYRDEDLIHIILCLAASKAGETELLEWIRSHIITDR